MILNLLSWNRRRFYINVLGLVGVVILGSCALRQFFAGIPSLDTLQDYSPSLTTRMYDVHGEVIAEFFTERRALLSLSDIPVDMQNAVIAVEDNRFFTHWGISPRGILRAAWKNFWSGRVVQGGSTVTQQLSRVMFLSQERTLLRKLRELVLAFELEYLFSKEEILQMYLNQIYFGHGAYGLQAAARIYFGKEFSQLSLADCALLAGLIQSPATHSPFNHPDKAQARRAIVLARMREEGFISPRQEEAADQEPFPTVRPPLSGTKAPYFVEYLRQELEPKYGFQKLWKGGLKIYTTLDLQMQKEAEAVMEKHLQLFDETKMQEISTQLKELAGLMKDRPGMDVGFSTAAPNVQGALVTLEVKTGAIRAMIGGRDYKSSQFNRATQARRQPGSTFKPFVWTVALENGFTASSIVDDLPIAYYYDGRDWRLFEGATDYYSIAQATSPFPQELVYVPGNFDDKFLGPVTLRQGLEKSRNLVSIRLNDKVGPGSVARLAHRMGIKSRLDPVVSLGLGTSVVSVLELTNAFASFANAGVHAESYGVIRIEDSEGKVLEENAPQEQEVLSPQIDYLMVNLMKGVVQNGTARAARRLKRPVGGKTGTSQEHRDLWFVGFTPDLATGAWMGYDDFTPLGRKDLTGGSTVVPLWTDYMEKILADYPPRDFSAPDGIVFAKVDLDSGMLALPSCPRVGLEAFLKDTEPKNFCNKDHSLPAPGLSGVNPGNP